jgi:hypothetical protein
MPTTQLQLRRGNTAQTAIFTGAVGEVTVNTQKKTLIVHDGVTAGGTEIALQAYASAAYHAANNAGSTASDAYQHAASASSYANSAFAKANTITVSVLTNESSNLSLSSNGVVFLPKNTTFFNNTITYSTNTSNQILDYYDSTQFRTSKYTIQSETETDIHSSEILVSHDGSSVLIKEFGNVKTGSSLFTLNASLASNVVSILITPMREDTVVDFVRTSLPTRLNIQGISGDLLTQSGTTDLNTSDGTTDLNL